MIGEPTKNLRNTATARLRTEKKGWEKEKLNAAKHDPTTIWKNVKSWLCWGNSGPPSRIFSGGEMLTSPARVAETMNRFFISKVQSLRDRIPATQDDSLKKLKEVMRNRDCSFSLHPISPDEVERIIAGLKNSKSTGTDFIDTWVIKLIARDILPAVTHILNLSFSQSEFPTVWK